MNDDFWRGRRVLLTGHTGFKGAWTAALLSRAGAAVHGFALAPDQEPSLYRLIRDRLYILDRQEDLRDAAAVARVVQEASPQVVIHMAAQARVRRGYAAPEETYATNVMGTLHLLEALRGIAELDAVLVVTTDKVYLNPDRGEAFKEGDPLGGSDPYSASKAACEILVQSCRESYYASAHVPLATARGGNVIGGGDWSPDRLVPDVYRAAMAGATLQLRHPDAGRPWQHVLDCCDGYLRYLEHLVARRSAEPPSLNFGPKPGTGMSVASLAEAMIGALGRKTRWQRVGDGGMPEKGSLVLDCGLAKRTLGWSPRLGMSETIAWTADWYRRFANGESAAQLVDEQISRYFAKT